MKVISANPVSTNPFTKEKKNSGFSMRISKHTERIFFIVSGLIGWLGIMLASYFYEMLFFTELLVSSFIIWCVIVLRFIQPTGTDWIEERNKRNS